MGLAALRLLDQAHGDVVLNGQMAASIGSAFGNGAASFTSASVGNPAAVAMMGEGGNINVQISAAGINPGATGADNVLAAFFVPGSCLDQAFRGLSILVQGSIVNNANTKRVKIIVNPATAVVGSTVGAGGTTVADTGSVTTVGGGFSLAANIFKYGGLGSNTQLGLHQQSIIGATPGALLAPSLVTANEAAGFWIAVTGAAGTATTDIVFNFLQIEGMN